MGSKSPLFTNELTISLYQNACDSHGNTPPPPTIPGAPLPGSVHQLLLSVCPLLPLKAKDFTKEAFFRAKNIYGPRPTTGTGCGGEDNIRRIGSVLSVCPEEGWRNGNEQMCF